MANVAEECLKKLRLLQTSSTAFVTGELKRMESVLEMYVSERKGEKKPWFNRFNLNFLLRQAVFTTIISNFLSQLNEQKWSYKRCMFS